MSSRHLDPNREPEPLANAFPPTADSAGDFEGSAAQAAAPEVGQWRLIDNHRYLVLGEHARGGLGRILTARDCDLNRPVALKELLAQSRSAQVRFAREAEITARLQHPGIVPIYGVGRWPTGKPFYAMKLISGQSLADAIADRRTLNDRLALLPTVIAVAEAIAYAHEQGIIHRDLKPPNVLLGRFGETVVIDWGLAAEAGQSQHPAAPETTDSRPRLTVAGTVMGTPEYMPPEQARGEAVDERADVYALGAMLYHLIAGVPPYQGSSSQEVLSELASAPPIPLEQRAPNLAEELAAIVRRAMARSKGERYPTAKELAEDLRRFQTGKLVGAHQYSSLELIQRWINRHRAAVAVAGLSLLILVVGGLLALRWIVQARDMAEARRNEMILVQVNAAMDRDPTSALAWLKTYPGLRSDDPAVRNLASEARSRGVARHVFGRDTGRASYVGFSPDGALLGAASENRTVRLSDLFTGKPVLSIPYDGDVRAVNFSPDGKTFLFTEWEGTIINVGRVDKTAFRVFRGHRAVILSRKFSPDGRLIASAGMDGLVYLWDVETGKPRLLAGHGGPVFHVDFSPDGRSLASASSDQTVRVWDVATGDSRVLTGYLDGGRWVQFSPDGATLASLDARGTIKLWDLGTWHPRATYHFNDVALLAFSPNGRLLATAGGTAIRVLDTQTSAVRSLVGHQGTVLTSSFSPDGAWIASGGQDGTIRLWELDSEQHRVIRGHTGAIDEVVFSKDGRYLASTGDDRTTRVWDVQAVVGGRSILGGHQDAVMSVGFSRDGRLLASGGRDNTVHIWNLHTSESQVLRGHQALVFRVAFSPDSRLLASAGYDGAIRLWNIETGGNRVLSGHEKAVSDIQFSSSGQLLASAGADGTIRVWDTRTGAQRVLRGHQDQVRALAFSPDDLLLASTSNDKTVRLWDIATGGDRIITRHQNIAYTVAFSPDGTRIASGGFDWTVRVSETHSDANHVFSGHRGRIRSVAFSPDGKLLASGGEDGTVRMWDLASGNARVFSGHRDEVRHLAFSPDGKRLASASWDNTVRLWDVGSGYLVGLDPHADHVLNLAFAPDGRSIASSGSEKGVYLWRIDSLVDLPENAGQFVHWMDSLTSAIVRPTHVVVTP